MTTVRRVHRYRSLLALTALLVAAGVATGSRTLVVAGVVPLVYIVQGSVATATPLGERVRLERELRPETPLPGQPVEVTLTAENVGETAIPDLRFVDGVPEELAVADGQARASGALRPGATTSTTYTLVADRGAYEFDEVSLRSRTVGGTALVDASRRAEGDDDFECRVAAEDVPLRRRTTAFTGPLATETGGPGVEFRATREYRNGDPARRIDWNRYAKTGELSTIEYREQRAARVAIVVDSRPPAHVAAGESLPTGATLCAYAATLALGILSEDGHHVAVGALGVADPVGSAPAPAWATDAEGSSFAARAAAVCNAAATGTDASVSMATPVATDGGRGERGRLLSLLPADAQVLLCSPALDEEVTALAEAVRAGGHDLTLLSPQVTPASVGGRVVDLARARRLAEVRSLGGTVVDWPRDEQLPIALARSLEGVSGR